MLIVLQLTIIYPSTKTFDQNNFFVETKIIKASKLGAPKTIKRDGSKGQQLNNVGKF